MPLASKEVVSLALQGLEAMLGRPFAVLIISDTSTPNFIIGKIRTRKEMEATDDAFEQLWEWATRITCG